MLRRSLSGDFWRFDGVMQKAPAVGVDATVNGKLLWIFCHAALRSLGGSRAVGKGSKVWMMSIGAPHAGQR